MRPLLINQEWCDTLCRTPVMSRRDEQLCAKIIQRGSKAKFRAADKLSEANIRFVIGYCAKWTGNGIDFSDLVSAGLRGLMDSAKKFKPDRGRFVSYAVWEIRHKIQVEIAQFKHPVMLPLNTVTETAMITKSIEKYRAEFGVDPLREDLHEMGHPHGRIDAGIAYKSFPISLNVPPTNSRSGATYDERDDIITNIRANDETDKLMVDKSAGVVIESIFKELTKREKKVMVEYFGLDGFGERTLQTIGDELGITREGVRQIKRMVIDRVKGNMSRRGWEKFEGVRQEVAMWE